MPTINHAFHLVQQIEKQKQVTIMKDSDGVAFVAAKDSMRMQQDKKKVKEKMFCKLYRSEGHKHKEMFLDYWVSKVVQREEN